MKHLVIVSILLCNCQFGFAQTRDNINKEIEKNFADHFKETKECRSHPEWYKCASSIDCEKIEIVCAGVQSVNKKFKKEQLRCNEIIYGGLECKTSSSNGNATSDLPRAVCTDGTCKLFPDPSWPRLYP